MSEGDSLRELITERLTAAAEDIFELVKTTIVEYKKELERQRKLLDIFLTPAVCLHRIEVPPQLACKEEEVLLSEQLCNQDRNSIPDQLEAEPPWMKEEPEEPCSLQEGEQLELKEETDVFMLTPVHEERNNSEQELHEQQLLSGSTQVVKDQDPAGIKHRNSSRTSEPNILDNIYKSSHNIDASENQCTPLKDQPSFKCDICGESFRNKLPLWTHQRVHSGKETHSCKICGKEFIWKSLLKSHIRSHTGERPYSCTACGQGFSRSSDLKKHNTIHTGEKPFTCPTCGRSFALKHHLKVHMRTHTGEKPYSCRTCGERFSEQKNLSHQNNIHTHDWLFSRNTRGKTCRESTDLKKCALDRQPHSCITCGKGFYKRRELTSHMLIHSNEKPYSCGSCASSFTS